MSQPLLSVGGLSVWRGERHLLSDVTWAVLSGERWLVLGANGSGKTTLVRVATWWDRPSAGELTLLGHRLGRADVRSVRTEVGFVSVAFADKIRPGVTAHDVVVSARHGAGDLVAPLHRRRSRQGRGSAGPRWAWPASASAPSGR
nr:ATP-binding cassette domain-containing protein [Candidatus Microthrix sp.]